MSRTDARPYDVPERDVDPPLMHPTFCAGCGSRLVSGECAWCDADPEPADWADAADERNEWDRSL